MSTFVELGISSKVADAVRDAGWTEPTPVQCAAIPAALEGKDVLAQAQTGTGKTGAYALPVLSRIKCGLGAPQAIVLAPTRELAVQIENEIYKLSRYSGHKSVAVYGGASIGLQASRLERGVDLVVGTPGRVKDMMERGHLDLSFVSEAVLDEADRMLDMGFSEELDFIMDALPKKRRTSLFSATMAPEVKKAAAKYMFNPTELLVSVDEPCSDLTKQYFIPVSRMYKFERLATVLGRGNPKTIVFCQTKKMVDELIIQLSGDYKSAAMHGDMPQMRRDRVMKNFRNDMFQVLIATDVAARGLDVNNVDLVVNYDVPPDSDTYMHRIGRTGRAGKEGAAVSFVTKMEDRRISMYERATGKEIMRVRAEDIPVMDHQFTDPEPVVKEKRERRERKPAEVSAERPRAAETERRERNPAEASAERPRAAETERPQVSVSKPVKVREKKGSVILQINLGRDDGLTRVQIAQFITDGLGGTGIGRIGLGESSSFFELPYNSAKAVTEAINGCSYGSKTVTVQEAPQKVRYAERSRAAPSGN
ncbi:MAG: DEAD/DEAH box helicase [Candidatus Methanoplasma sp.]|jgi:ATP-dependent RNA helicase DeaD|nr:DEAD/DEAH box helicase [Candidatus Methanoplasma sp.]